jgi:chromate reductase
MSEFEIAIVIGSLRRESFNRKLATGVVKVAPPSAFTPTSQAGRLIR